jgi:cytochrome P450 PksS
VVDGLLDRAAAGFQIDAVANLARPFAATVFAELLGIPLGERPAFREWSDDATSFLMGSRTTAETPSVLSVSASALLEDYVGGLLEERRRQPGEDLLSLLLASGAEVGPGAALGCSRIVLLLAAGLTTTIDQLSNAVFALLTHPDQLERLRTDPTLARSAVEESLRYDGPIPFVPRIAKEDLKVAGWTIRGGERVYLCLAAANRDPVMFTDPDRFDVRRQGYLHLAFGAGPFQCLGAGLARREMEAALRATVRRLPRLRLDPDYRPQRKPPSLNQRGFASLPIRFS